MLEEAMNKCARMIYWDEMNEKQKIEILSERLEYLKILVDRQGEIIQKLENHVHVNEKIFYGQGVVTPLCWPNENILNRRAGSK